MKSRPRQKLDKPPEISSNEANTSLKSSVCEVLGFYGFSSGSEEALQTFTDVSEDFLKKICLKLSEERDRHLKSHSSGFSGKFKLTQSVLTLFFIWFISSDVLDRVFRDLRIPNVIGLLDFYDKEVVQMFKGLIDSCSTNFALENSSSPSDPSPRPPSNADPISSYFVNSQVNPQKLNKILLQFDDLNS